MKQYFELIALPLVNISVFAFIDIPSMQSIENAFKLLLLIATFIYTVLKIIFLLKRKKAIKDEE